MEPSAPLQLTSTTVRFDQLLRTWRDWSDVHGEGRGPAGQEMLAALRAVEQRILALDLKVSKFATAALATIFHAFIAIKTDGKQVPAIIARARNNLQQA